MTFSAHQEGVVMLSQIMCAKSSNIHTLAHILGTWALSRWLTTRTWEDGHIKHINRARHIVDLWLYTMYAVYQV